MLDGRVKTLHPRIAGGVLAMRSNPDHMRQIAEHQLHLIDLVCVNLYPFAETIRKPGVSFEEVIENIDIGGPTMIRAAAKNFQDVVVLTSPDDYSTAMKALKSGNGVLDRDLLFTLSRKAFLCTARYDSQIAQHLSGMDAPSGGLFPENLFMDFEKVADLRYGENPHQKAAFYRTGGQKPTGLAAAKQLPGKGTFLQQHRRSRCSLGTGSGIRSAGVLRHQAYESMRHGYGQQSARRVCESL
jgi:phosphoribosylaminoimidazolecarboxamide formyltransferase/IMP cyclohydrolase